MSKARKESPPPPPQTELERKQRLLTEKLARWWNHNGEQSAPSKPSSEAEPKLPPKRAA